MRPSKGSTRRGPVDRRTHAVDFSARRPPASRLSGGREGGVSTKEKTPSSDGAKDRTLNGVRLTIPPVPTSSASSCGTDTIPAVLHVAMSSLMSAASFASAAIRSAKSIEGRATRSIHVIRLPSSGNWKRRWSTSIAAPIASVRARFRRRGRSSGSSASRASWRRVSASSRSTIPISKRSPRDLKRRRASAKSRNASEYLFWSATVTARFNTVRA